MAASKPAKKTITLKTKEQPKTASTEQFLAEALEKYPPSPQQTWWKPTLPDPIAFDEWEKNYIMPEFKAVQVGPNPFLGPAAQVATTSTTSSLIAPSAPKALEPSPQKQPNGQKVAPSVAKLQAKVTELMGNVVDLIHKYEKLSLTAETALTLAEQQQHLIIKLQNQLASHTHPMPSMQINGMYIALPNGNPPVIYG